MSRNEKEEQEEQQQKEGMEGEKESKNEESLVAGLMRVEEQLDDLSLQVQDYLHTVEARVDVRTQHRCHER